MIDEQSKQRLKQLCDQISKEQDHNRFSQLVTELNDLLDQSCAPKEHNNSEQTAESTSDHR